MHRTKYVAFVFLFCSCWSLSCCAIDGCPANCTCVFLRIPFDNNTNLWVSCRNRQAVEPDTDLTQEIDVMLANNTQLKKLSIEYTSLTGVPPAICNMTSLLHLFLNNNRLVALPDDCLSRLSQLRTFGARVNQITHLQDGLFDGLANLDSIELSQNEIQVIGSRVFSNSFNHPQLKKLDLSNNRLTSLGNGLFDGLTRLEFILLSNNEIRFIGHRLFSNISDLPRLRTINLSNNRLASLEDGLFDGLVHLEYINLSNNEIHLIGSRVFSNISDLPRLTSINLAKNRLTSIGSWPVIRAQASLYGLTVQLCGNQIKTFEYTGNWTHKCRFSQQKPSNLTLCADSGSRVTELVGQYSRAKGDLACFIYRGNHGSNMITIDNFEWSSCDCVRFDFDIFRRFGIRDFRRVSVLFNSEDYFLAPNDNIQIEFASNFAIYVTCRDVPDYVTLMSRNDFQNLACYTEVQCPVHCQCFSTPHNKTLHVLCAGTGLTEVPLELSQLNGTNYRLLQSQTISDIVSMPRFYVSDFLLEYKLDISGNTFSVLEARPYFKDIIILNASNSTIENVSVDALMALQQADKIYLHDNLLTTLPREVTTMNFSFSSLSLHNNPLDCSCDQLWLKQWFHTINDRLENPNGIICNNPPRLRNQSVLLISESDFCPKPDVRIIASAVVAPLVCIALIILLLRIFRVESYKRFRFHPFDRDECDGEEMTYDVFISYAHGDKELARELLEFLESNGCKVCFHQRDFMAGETVMENILEAVYTSKRVLCLVTANFLQSEYCLDEFNIAQTRNLELKKRRLIIMKYEEFDIGAEMDAATNGDARNRSQFNVHLNVSQIAFDQNAKHSEDRAQLDKALVLRDFVTRHTFINLSAADSWRDQFLYAMPIHRLGSKPSNT